MCHPGARKWKWELFTELRSHIVGEEEEEEEAGEQCWVSEQAGHWGQPRGDGKQGGRGRGLESTLVPLTGVLWHWSRLEMWDAMEAVPGGGGGGGRRWVFTLPSRDRVLEFSCLSCHRFPVG